MLVSANYAGVNDSNVTVRASGPSANYNSEIPGIPGMKDASQSGDGVKDKLGACIVRILDSYFPDYRVNDVRVSIAADARFLNWIPTYVSLIKPNAAAVTFGLYDIHYDPTQINLESPSWGAIWALVEELAHGEQFLKMWQKMPMVPATRRRSHAVGREPLEDVVIAAHRPTYESAQVQWGITYAEASARAAYFGLDSYKFNAYEIEAQAKRDTIFDRLKTRFADKYARGESICP